MFSDSATALYSNPVSSGYKLKCCANFAANVPFPDAEVPSTATIIHLSPYLMELGNVNLQPICVISS